MTATVQLHSRVLQITKENIKLIAEAQRCQLGAVVDKAVAEYLRTLKSGESITLPPSAASEQPLTVIPPPQPF